MQTLKNKRNDKQKIININIEGCVVWLKSEQTEQEDGDNAHTNACSEKINNKREYSLIIK